jgi:hypothetical protein
MGTRNFIFVFCFSPIWIFQVMNRFSVSPPIDCFNGGGGLSHLGDGRQLNGSTITEKGGIRAFFQMDGAIPPKKRKR